MAERQQTHRQELEGIVVRGNSRRATRGQIFAFLLGLAAVGGGIFLIANGMDTQGLTSIIVAFTSLAAVFIYGRYQQAKERADKRREAREATQQPELPF